ncbi:hypothetical protein [Halobaculum litoreum]|uniref:Uncharacterized protein n=1 Tax=Halobaculum litoreum TaxID=3031998 RepID=A0ABD5XP42_9EURY|nr:hypothetical protein [Halobaculum sp. DT92]
MSSNPSPSSVVEPLLRPAAVVAVAVALLGVVLSAVRALAVGAPVRIGEIVVDQVVGVLGTVALVAAVLALVTLGTTADVVKWSVVGLYGANLVEGVLFRLANGFPVMLDVAINPLFTAALFVGFVAAVRIARGETVLPGVDVTVDAERLRVRRPGRRSS